VGKEAANDWAAAADEAAAAASSGKTIAMRKKIPPEPRTQARELRANGE